MLLGKDKMDVAVKSVMEGESDVIRANWIKHLDDEVKNCEFGRYTQFLVFRIRNNGIKMSRLRTIFIKIASLPSIYDH